MNKTELIAEISENVNMSKRDVEYVLAATLDVITNAMIRGESVQLFGFGTFEVKDRAPRTGRNPKSGEAIRIDASRAPIFRPAPALKQAVKDTRGVRPVTKKILSPKPAKTYIISLPQLHDPGAKGRVNPVIARVWPLYLNLGPILLQL